MRSTALLIGPAALLRRLECQLDLLPERPVTIGWITTDDGAETDPEEPVVGTLDQLEAIVSRRRPGVALVSLPAVMRDHITSIRTRLRRLGVADRFMPTLEDQVAGVGPRTYLDVDVTALLDRAPREVDAEVVGELVSSRRVLITGAGGSIGGELARIVARFRPERLALMDRSENALFEIDRQIARCTPQVPRTPILHDVVEQSGTLAHCRDLRPHIVFHAAAHKHVPIMEDHPGAAVDNNLFGTKAIADAAAAVDVERFVMVSTDKAVRPSSIMGATKRLAELYVQTINERSTTAFSMVRFGNVLGSSGSVLETWAKQIADGGPVTITDPRMTRYFMTIPEAAALVIESAALVDPAASNGEVFLLDMGEPVRILDLAQRFIRTHGLEPVARGSGPSPAAARRPGTVTIVDTGARPGEKLHEELVCDADCMRATRNPDINVWLLPPPSAGHVERILAALDPALRPRDPRTLATEIRRLVPEMVQPVAA